MRVDIDAAVEIEDARGDENLARSAVARGEHRQAGIDPYTIGHAAAEIVDVELGRDIRRIKIRIGVGKGRVVLRVGVRAERNLAKQRRVGGEPGNLRLPVAIKFGAEKRGENSALVGRLSVVEQQRQIAIVVVGRGVIDIGAAGAGRIAAVGCIPLEAERIRQQGVGMVVGIHRVVEWLAAGRVGRRVETAAHAAVRAAINQKDVAVGRIVQPGIGLKAHHGDRRRSTARRGDDPRAQAGALTGEHRQDAAFVVVRRAVQRRSAGRDLQELPAGLRSRRTADGAAEADVAVDPFEQTPRSKRRMWIVRVAEQNHRKLIEHDIRRIARPLEARIISRHRTFLAGHDGVRNRQ